MRLARTTDQAEDADRDKDLFKKNMQLSEFGQLTMKKSIIWRVFFTLVGNEGGVMSASRKRKIQEIIMRDKEFHEEQER